MGESVLLFQTAEVVNGDVKTRNGSLDRSKKLTNVSILFNIERSIAGWWFGIVGFFP
jgi:hypothetical protein